MKILITDEKSGGYEYNHEYFAKIHNWAKTQCVSYKGFTVVDVSDHSLIWDEIAEYEITDEKDAILFKLAWGGKLSGK